MATRTYPLYIDFTDNSSIRKFQPGFSSVALAKRVNALQFEFDGTADGTNLLASGDTLSLAKLPDTYAVIGASLETDDVASGAVLTLNMVDTQGTPVTTALAFDALDAAANAKQFYNTHTVMNLSGGVGLNVSVGTANLVDGKTYKITLFILDLNP